MYSPESFFDLIKEHVSKLNYEWFQKKEKMFKNHSQYDGEHEVISILVKDYEEHDPVYDNEDELVSKTIVDAAYHIKIDLKEFCACYFPIDDITGWGAFPLDEYDIREKVTPSNNIDEFARQLIFEIGAFLKPLSDNVETYKFVSTVLDLVEKEIRVLKELHPSGSIYISVLDSFLKKCTDYILSKYGKELTIYKLINDHTPKLEFSLTQDQLLAVIFILQRAGFFNYTDNTPILRFVLNHFLYKDEKGGMVSPSEITNLQKKYSAIVASQATGSKQVISHKGLNDVESALSAILQKLK